MSKFYGEEPSISFIKKLKLDLAVRKNNEHTGTGLGGNASQLFYLMTHDIKSEHSPDEVVHIRQENDIVIFQIPKKFSILDIRKAFNEFWELNLSQNEIDDSQLLDPTWLSDYQAPRKIDLHYLTKAIVTARDVAGWLDQNKKFRKQISDFFRAEYKDVEEKYLLDIGLPIDYLAKIDLLEQSEERSTEVSCDTDPVRSSLEKHPVWGNQIKSIDKRKNEMIKLVLSESVLKKLNIIGSYPGYIALLVMRTEVSIDRVVYHNLDEYIDWMTELNKEIESISE